MRARSVLPVLLLLVTACALAACSSDGSDGGAPRPTTTGAPDATTTTFVIAETTGAPLDPTLEVPADQATSPAATRLQLRPVLGSQPCSSVTPDDPDAPQTTVAGPTAPELVPDTDGTLCFGLGPVAATGADLTGATVAAADEDSWLVTVTARPGSVDRLDGLFNACHDGTDRCPAESASGTPGRVAIVLDGVVRSAPTVMSADLARDAIQITGSFTQAEAEDLAALLST